MAELLPLPALFQKERQNPFLNSAVVLTSRSLLLLIEKCLFYNIFFTFIKTYILFLHQLCTTLNCFIHFLDF